MGKLGRVVGAGFSVWFVNGAISWLTCGWLFNWMYKLPPNIWKSDEAIMTFGNMLGVNTVGLLRAFVFVCVFAFLYKAVPGRGALKGLWFGFLAWIMGPLPGVISLSFFMTISTTVVVYWAIIWCLTSLIDGLLVGVIYKDK